MNLLRDNKKTRWAVLFIISFVMFAAYVASDNIFAVETTLQGDAYQISDSEYSSLAGAYSIFNVYLLMLIFGGIILDKKGIRFTGTMAAGLMVLGIGMLTFAMFRLRTLVAGGAVMETVNFLGDTLRPQVLIAVIGIGIYGVGAEIAGITATKVIAKWFIGYEMALAMGLQLALARLGTGLAYGLTPGIVKACSGNVGIAVLVGLILLGVGLLAFLAYCVYDKKLDTQIREQGVKEAESNPEDEFSWKDVIAVVKNPAFWMIALLCLLFYAAVNPFLKYSTGMMVNKFGIDQTLAGLFPMILPMGCIVLTPLFGGVYDKKGHGADLMILGAAIITGVHVVFALLPGGASAVFPIMLMVLLGIGFALLPSAMWPSIIFVPKAIGAIKGASGDYMWVSVFFAGLGLVAIVLALGIKLLDKKKQYGLQQPNIQS